MEENISSDEMNFLKRLKLKCSKFLLINIELIVFGVILLFKSALFNDLIGVRYSHLLLFITCLGSIVILTGISTLFRRRVRIVLLLIFDFIISVVMLSDLYFFRYFNDVLSVPVLKQAILMDTLQDSILNLVRKKDLIFLIDVFVFIPIIVNMFKNNKVENIRTIKHRIISFVSVVIIGIAVILYGFNQINKVNNGKVLSYFTDHSFFVENVGVINYHVFDIAFALSDALSDEKKVDNNEKEKLKEVFSNKSFVSSGTNLNGVAKGNNLIVIQVEALQNIVLDLKVNGKEVTPNLNKFAKKSIYFNNYFAQTAQGGTSDAEFLSNVSYYPIPQGAVYFHNASNTFESLPKLMKENGYKTNVMHAFRANYWNRSTIYPILGFDKFFSMNDYNNNEIIAWGLSDKAFFNQSIEKMKTIEEPFYSFVITLSSHYPFDAFNNDKNFDTGSYNGTFFGNYLKAIHYTDSAFGEFFKELEKNGLLDNSVIAIYGDHPAIQKERLDEVEKLLKINSNDDIGWVQMTNVPLIIHLPDDKGAGKRSIAGGQIDLFPTVANLFGINPKYALGKDLLNTERGYAIFRDGSITDGKTVYLRKYNECFNIKSGNKISNEKFNEYIDIAMEQLNISDEIVKNNLIPYFEGNTGKK